MEIIAGMILLCSVKLSLMGDTLFIKNIETRVHHITPKKFAIIEYNFKKNKNVRFLPLEDSPNYDILTLQDLRDKNYANCRKMSNEQKIKK